MLDWLYTAISWVMLRWHDLLSTFMPADNGLTWALSILLLVVTIRILLFRFFVKQVKTQRAMQELQPKIQELRKKYKDDKQAQSREIMKLQQESGVNMLGGCLPVLLQAPVFISLFHVLRYISPTNGPLYGWTREQMVSASHAKLFGAPIPTSFSLTDRIHELGGNVTSTRIVCVFLIICMVAATFLTQKMVAARASGATDPQQAMIQKLMLYGMPASLLVSGFFFPVGVLVYWFTNNLWTLGQQFYILKRMPVKTDEAIDKRPSEAAKALAPKPGAKPLHPKARRAGVDEPQTSDDVAAAPKRPVTAPKPGAKPSTAAAKKPATPTDKIVDDVADAVEPSGQRAAAGNGAARRTPNNNRPANRPKSGGNKKRRR